MRPLGLSYRRILLDVDLERLTPGLEGVVLEIGAKVMARGRWRPRRDRVRRWVRVDLEVVCVEVLQYVVSPEAAMREIARVLVPGGTAVLTVPFFHRADGPTDRHRFTEMRARELVETAGLRTLALATQGRFFTTLANQLRQGAAHVASRPARWLVGAGLAPLTALLLVLDGLGPVRRSPFLSSFATGFVALARKG